MSDDRHNLTLRLDEETYQRLRWQAFNEQTTITALIRAALEADRQRDHELVVRPNPPLPSDEYLAHAYTLNGAGVNGLRAIWRNGCDAGMVAPLSADVSPAQTHHQEADHG